MSPMSARANPQVWRFPRVSGDEPFQVIVSP